MASNLSPQEYVEKWKQRVSQSGKSFSDGVNRVQISPGTLAAQQKQLYIDNVIKSQEKWAQNTAAVSLSSWKQSTGDLGAQRYQSGAAKGAAKLSTFASQYLPFVQSAAASLPPRGNESQNMQRFMAMNQALKGFTYSKRSL